MRQTPEPLDWHDIARLLGRESIKLPAPISTPVRSCDSLMEAIERDRKSGLIPAKPSNAELPVPVKPVRCPCCGWPHPGRDGCKALERRDYA